MQSSQYTVVHTHFFHNCQLISGFTDKSYLSLASLEVCVKFHCQKVWRKRVLFFWFLWQKPTIFIKYTGIILYKTPSYHFFLSIAMYCLSNRSLIWCPLINFSIKSQSQVFINLLCIPKAASQMGWLPIKVKMINKSSFRKLLGLLLLDKNM